MAVPAHSTPATIAHGTTHITSPDDLPEIYTIIMHGDRMLPKFAGGSAQAFSNLIEPKPNDIVAIWFKQPGSEVVHNRLVLRLVSISASAVVAETLSPRNSYTFNPAEIAAISVWLGRPPVYGVMGTVPSQVSSHAPAALISPRDLPKQYILPASMLGPAVESGDDQVFTTVDPIRKDDVVAVWRKPETLAPGEPHVHLFRIDFGLPDNWHVTDPSKVRTNADMIIVFKTAAKDKAYLYRASEIEAIHKWVGPLRKGEPAPKLLPNTAEPSKEVIAVTSNVPTAQGELSLLSGPAGEPLTMSSREIAELTEKRHDHVIRDTRVLLDAVFPGWEKDAPKLGDQGISITYDNRGYVFEIRLPKDLTITLVAGYDANLRLKIIRRWMELEGTQSAKPAVPEFPIPQTFAEALMLAANQAAQIEHQKGAIAEMKPKAEFHDDVASAVNAQTFMDVAKAFGTGRTRFTRWLRARSFVMENLRPYQQYIDAGYFRVVEKKRKDPETGEKFVYVQTLITGKGVTYLQRKWAEDNKDAAE